jgi:hypothetical protein
MLDFLFVRFVTLRNSPHIYGFAVFSQSGINGSGCRFLHSPELLQRVHMTVGIHWLGVDLNRAQG